MSIWERTSRGWQFAWCAAAWMLIGVVADCCQAKIISAVERLDGGAAPGLRDGAVAPTFAGLTPIWSDYAFFALDAPAYLRGSDLLMTRYNFDKIDPDYQLRVTLARPATVFVLVDDRVPDVPTTMPWLAALGFVDTGDNLDVRVSFDQRLTFASIYRADFSAGPIVLREQHDSNVNSGMYFVAAVPEPGTLVLVFVAVCACGLPFAAANGWRTRSFFNRSSFALRATAISVFKVAGLVVAVPIRRSATNRHGEASVA